MSFIHCIHTIYVFIFWEHTAKLLLSNEFHEFRSDGTSDGTSHHCESSSRKHMKTDIYGLIQILVDSIFMDFVDPIIHEYKSTTNYE